MPDPITQVTFQNAGVLTLQAGFTSFGQHFQIGDLPSGAALFAEIGGEVVPVQMDVRTTHPDGSVKMAVLTMMRPELAPWQDAPATLFLGEAAAAAPPVSLAAVLAGHDATLTLAIEDGRPPLSIDIGAALTQALAAGTASYWQQGPFATQARVEIPVENASMRIVLDVTGYADGEIRFTVGLNNDRAMEAVGGRLSYVATVELDGETLFQQGLNHGQYQRVSLDFASSDAHGVQGLGAPQEGWLNIKHDIEYLKGTGAIFLYDTNFVSSPGDLRFYYNQVANNPQWGEIFWAHNLQTSMGTAGGRPEIGYTTAPNAHWILSQDAAAAAYAMGQAKVAGYVPWNFYDMANGTVLNTDNYPRLWTDSRGGTGTPGSATSGGLTQQWSSDTGWWPDTAHQPDLSFIPYIMTGERWMYDNVLAQASHSIMYTWPAVRDDGTGLVVQNNQIRASAWALRQIDHAAWIAEDGSFEQDYFGRKVADNLNWILSKADAWSATYGEIAGFIPSNAYAGHIPAWQTHLLAGVIALSALRGHDEALEVLDFMSNYLVGVLTSADQGFDPHNAVVIRMPTSVGGVPLTSWGEVADALKAEGIYADGRFAFTELAYHRMLVAGLAMAYEATGEARYRDAVEIFLQLMPGGTATDNYVRSPQEAVTIRELHDLYRDDPRYPKPGFEPVETVLGSGPDEIRLSISQDYYDFNVKYRVFVDGKQVGGPLTASALKSLAQADTVIIRGDFGDTVTVRVQMINDLVGGSGAKDRNLYVNAISYNGQDLPTRAYLATNTAQDFVFTADGTMISPPALVKPEPNAIPIPAIDPLPPKTVIVGEGPDEMVITLNQDWYLESARYAVLVDGKQVGAVQEAAAFRSAGETDTLIVRGVFTDGPARVEIRFVNDRTDGYGRDRNLHIQSASLNGEPIDILPKPSLMSQNETARIAFERPDLTPKTVVIGAGPDELVFEVNQNYWKGKSEYLVLVDGQQYGDRQKVNALLANGEYDTVVVRGTFPEGTKVGLRFLNDTHEGPNQGRDIFVHAAAMNGEALALSRRDLLMNGHVATVEVGVPAPGTVQKAPPMPQFPASAPAEDIAPRSIELGAGPDTIVVRLNQDWYLESARYVVLVDGMQLGGVQTAGALRMKGQTDTLTIRGDFDVTTTLAIRFVNDAFYGNANSDRNLFVQSVAFNGVNVAIDRTYLLLAGDTATADLAPPAPVTPPSSPSPSPPVDPGTVPPGDIPQGPGLHVFGEGQDEVVIRLSYTPSGAPVLYRIFVGMEVYGDVSGLAVESLKSAGVADTVIVRGDFASQFHNGALHFGVVYTTGIGKGGLHIQGITINGQAVPDSVVSMTTAGVASFSVAALPPVTQPEPQPEPEPGPQPEPQPGPQPGPQPEPQPEPVTVGSGSDQILFKFASGGMAGNGGLRIEVDGVRVYDSATTPAGPAGVAVAFDPGTRTDFAIVHDGAGSGGAPSVAQVIHDDIVLPTLHHTFSGPGAFRFALHQGDAGNNLHVGTGGRDVFILNGGMDTIITGAGADLLVIREPGFYSVMDFDLAQDRIVFETMRADSLAVTQSAKSAVIAFEGGAIFLNTSGVVDLERIVLPPSEPFG